MSNVRAISTRATQVNYDVVQLLTDWLARAQAGEFNGIAVVGITPHGAVESAASENNDHPRMIGAVTLLQHHVLSMPTSG